MLMLISLSSESCTSNLAEELQYLFDKVVCVPTTPTSKSGKENVWNSLLSQTFLESCSHSSGGWRVRFSVYLFSVMKASHSCLQGSLLKEGLQFRHNESTE